MFFCYTAILQINYYYLYHPRLSPSVTISILLDFAKDYRSQTENIIQWQIGLKYKHKIEQFD